MATRPRFAHVDIPGASLCVREWGPTSGPTRVLLHGGAAHSGWWDHLAPCLSRRGRVVALDSSGQGDSTWRTSYSLEGWARETCDALAVLVGHEPVTLVGHSRGGMISLLAASGVAKLLRLVVVEGSFGISRLVVAGKPRPHRVYTEFDEAVRRFRTLPDEARLDYVLPHIGRQSQPAVVPTTLVRGDSGLASPEVVTVVQARLGAQTQVVTIPGAGHHIMLNRPIALIEELTHHVAS